MQENFIFPLELKDLEGRYKFDETGMVERMDILQQSRRMATSEDFLGVVHLIRLQRKKFECVGKSVSVFLKLSLFHLQELLSHGQEHGRKTDLNARINFAKQSLLLACIFFDQSLRTQG